MAPYSIRMHCSDMSMLILHVVFMRTGAVLSCLVLVQIADPQTVSGTFTSYTTYLIISSLSGEDGVRRRFSDFDWLRDVLTARYHGLAVPLMPEKRMVGNTGKAFVEERMA